jgi:hypothetical protein
MGHLLALSWPFADLSITILWLKRRAWETFKDVKNAHFGTGPHQIFESRISGITIIGSSRLLLSDWNAFLKPVRR